MRARVFGALALLLLGASHGSVGSSPYILVENASYANAVLYEYTGCKGSPLTRAFPRYSTLLINFHRSCSRLPVAIWVAIGGFSEYSCAVTVRQLGLKKEFYGAETACTVRNFSMVYNLQ